MIQNAPTSTLPPPSDTTNETSFAETALKLGGKSEEEARRTGAIDRADDQVEQLFKPQYQTVNSPIHRAVWDSDEVRDHLQAYVRELIADSDGMLVIDETGFLKKGKKSVGVQRQYTGSAGKVTNCQVGVSLTLATQTMHLPVDFELYLPESWALESV